jgi:hypothetical protein
MYFSSLPYRPIMTLSQTNLIRRLLIAGAASCLFFAIAISNSSFLRYLDTTYSEIILRGNSTNKIAYEMQLHCQTIQATLIDLLFVTSDEEAIVDKQIITSNFRKIDLGMSMLAKTAETEQMRRLLITINDSLLAYRRAASTYLVLLDEKKSSEASVFLRFNMSKTNTGTLATLASLSNQVDLSISNKRDKITSTTSTVSGIIWNAGIFPVLLWLVAASIIFLVYRGSPLFSARKK